MYNLHTNIEVKISSCVVLHYKEKFALINEWLTVRNKHIASDALVLGLL